MNRINTIIAFLLVAILIPMSTMAQDEKISLVDELTGQPEVNKWYKITPKGMMSAKGNQAYGMLRKGTANKVIVIFYGGGVSVDEFTAARGSSVDKNYSFYFDDINPGSEIGVPLLTMLSFGAPREDNPFKDWTYVVLPYCTGDFHTGTNDYPYTSLDGKPDILHHHGYTNWNMVMNHVVPYLGTPEALVITGYSAGGFATALCSDAVIDYFPKTKNVTSFVDSAIMQGKDWQSVAKNVWKAPKRIWKNLKGDELVSDALTALHKSKSYVKILYAVSVRDYALANYQKYMDGGDNHTTTADDGDVFQNNLKKFIERFKKNIPGGGIYIWDGVHDDTQDPTLTFHTIQLSKDFFTPFNGHESVCQWLVNAVNGDVKTFGTELVSNDYRKTAATETVGSKDDKAAEAFNPASLKAEELQDNAEEGKWYSITPEGQVVADGSQAVGYLRRGKENKVVVLFYGGGVSVNEFTAARGSTVDKANGFYADTMTDPNVPALIQILSALTFAAPAENNPFRDWTLVVIPYATGDFHCGTGDFPYTSLDGKQHILHHHGYTNFQTILRKAMPVLGVPEALVITGFSAGGFATAICSDAVCELFPQTKNVTSFIDSAFLFYKDWNKVATDVWKAPKEICNRIKSDNIVLDCLTALHKDRPNVKILFGVSKRDYALSLYQRHLLRMSEDYNYQEPATAQDGDLFEKNLSAFIDQFKKNIPEGGMFIWDGVPAMGQEQSLTHHCIELSGNFFTDFHGHGNFPQWIMDAVNGNVKTYGTELVGK